MSQRSLHRAWLVDLDGTLYHALPVKLAMGLELLIQGQRALPTIRAFRAQHEQLRDRPADPNQSPFERQVAGTAAQLQLSHDEVLARVNEWMHERPGKWLRRFRRSSLLREIATHKREGGLTALVSDYPARVKLEALQATTLFDAVIAAGEPLGPSRLKPDPEGYLLAARALQVDPSECLVIGDRPDADQAAAHAAGMAFRLIR